MILLLSHLLLSQQIHPWWHIHGWAVRCQKVHFGKPPQDHGDPLLPRCQHLHPSIESDYFKGLSRKVKVEAHIAFFILFKAIVVQGGHHWGQWGAFRGRGLFVLLKNKWNLLLSIIINGIIGSCSDGQFEFLWDIEIFSWGRDFGVGQQAVECAIDIRQYLNIAKITEKVPILRVQTNQVSCFRYLC